MSPSNTASGAPKPRRWQTFVAVIYVALLLVHIGLAVWAAMGFAEFVAPTRFPFGLDNERFPTGMQLTHWLAIGTGATAFLVTYAFFPRLMFPFMLASYAFMATVCFVQTLNYLDHDGKYWDMAIEYITYSAILIFLWLCPRSRAKGIG